MNDLWHRWQVLGDMAAHDQIWAEYQGFVISVAQSMAKRLPYRVELDDIISMARLGFAEAIRRYDPSRETPFPAYATMRIRGAIIDGVRSADFYPRKGSRWRPENPADREITSLNARPSFDSDLEWVDLLEDSAGDFTIQFLDRAQIDQIKALSRWLPNRYQLVFNLIAIDGYQLEYVGHYLGITQSRVCQIRNKAFRKILHAMNSSDEKPHMRVSAPLRHSSTSLDCAWIPGTDGMAVGNHWYYYDDPTPTADGRTIGEVLSAIRDQMKILAVIPNLVATNQQS